jgi:hypothetical protein
MTMASRFRRFRRAERFAVPVLEQIELNLWILRMDNEETAKQLSEMAGPPPPRQARPYIGLLEYRPAGSPEPERSPRIPAGIQFTVAFLGGVHTNSSAWEFTVLLTKICGGCILVSFRRSRASGIGLFCSLLVGCLIFGIGTMAECGHSWRGK